MTAIDKVRICSKCGEAPTENQDSGVLCHACKYKITNQLATYWTTGAAPAAETGAAADDADAAS
ncbi:hypothetical protein DMC63_37795 [Streptomyces sp. WAC 05977]|nr:hypothetical protein DMC63_37795 [Streptomyces sp. WAC 05977]